MKEKIYKEKAWRYLFFAICMAAIAIQGVGTGKEAKAAGDVSRYHTVYINQACPDISIIADGYIMGGSLEPKSGNTVIIYELEPGTLIQGKQVDPTYIPQGNIENLKEIYSEVVGYRDFTWINGGYLERQTSRLKVVAYDDRWVTFWDNGYKSFGDSPAMCKQYLLQESHPAGFYKIQRDKVVLDTRRRDNVIPDGEVPNVVAKGKTTTSVTGINPVPGKCESGEVYKVGINTELDIVSLDLVPSTAAGSSDTYYKVAFNVKTPTNYLANKGYYYINSKSVNVYRTDTPVPEGAVKAKVYNLTANKQKYLNVRSTPEITNGNILGCLYEGALVDLYQAESNSEWSVIFYNSMKAYVKSQYLDVDYEKKIPKNVGNLRILDIVDNQYVIGWDAIDGCTDYRVAITRTFPKLAMSGTNILYREYHYTTNSIVVDRAYSEGRNYLLVIVAANYGDTATKETYIELKPPYTPDKLKRKEFKAYKNKIQIKKDFGEVYSVQYSTDKNFTKAKIKQTGLFSNVKAIKNLKKNTTYYIRYRARSYVNTEAGGKFIYGKWTKATKVKTLKKDKVTKKGKKSKSSKSKNSKSKNSKSKSSKADAAKLKKQASKSKSKNIGREK